MKSIKLWYLMSAFLMFVSLIITNISVPTEIHYKNDGMCDIDNYQASYVLYEKNGNIIGEFCFLHTLMYNIKSSDWSSGIMIYDVPIEIEFLSFVFPVILVGILTFLYLEKVDWFLRKILENEIGVIIFVVSSLFFLRIIIMRIFPFILRL